MEYIRICVKHGGLTKDKCYVRNRAGKTIFECRQCIRDAILRRSPYPCSVHGSNPSEGWTRTGECRTCKKLYLKQYRKDKVDQCIFYERTRDLKKRRGQYSKSYYKRRAKILTKNKERNIKRKIRVLHHYSDGIMECAICKENRLYALAIDHIDDINKIGPDGGTKLYTWLEKHGYPKGFQVLCHNCNSLKSLPVCSSKPNSIRRYKRSILLKKEVISRYSDGKCECALCKNSDIRVLSIDHPNIDGAAHRRTLKIIGGDRFYRWLRREGYPIGYRILCFSCNLASYLERRDVHLPHLNREDVTGSWPLLTPLTCT